MLMLVLGESSLAVTITVLFIYTAELLPTVLRYGVWWVRRPWGHGAIGKDGTITGLMHQL